MTENKRDMPSTWSDPDDAPELSGEFFERADLYNADKLVRRGRGPNKLPTKERISIRLSSEVAEYFRSTGTGWQSRIDAVLKDWVAHH